MDKFISSKISYKISNFSTNGGKYLKCTDLFKLLWLNAFSLEGTIKTVHRQLVNSLWALCGEYNVGLFRQLNFETQMLARQKKKKKV